MHGRGLYGANHADRVPQLRPGREPLQVPTLAARLLFLPGEGFDFREQAPSIGDQVSILILQHRDEVFAVRQSQLTELGIQVERIAGDHVERPGIPSQQPLEQPPRRRHLALARLLQLQVQQQLAFLVQQHRRHITMVVLNPLTLLGGDRARQTLRTRAKVAGTQLVTIEQQRP